jgi:hypothetical protein
LGDVNTRRPPPKKKINYFFSSMYLQYSITLFSCLLEQIKRGFRIMICNNFTCFLCFSAEYHKIYVHIPMVYFYRKIRLAFFLPLQGGTGLGSGFTPAM